MKRERLKEIASLFSFAILFACFAVSIGFRGRTAYATDAAPVPLLKEGHAVSWWFVFKFNAKAFPACGTGTDRQCLFGGTVQPYTLFGQQYAFTSSEAPALQKGTGCLGDTDADPIGATFAQVYNGSFHYVVWNDQFYDDPHIAGCTNSCSAPWGHSKGMLAWNESGDGFVMQVSTPSWPASGSKDVPRQGDGNTLGCVTDNNVKVSQHFFALQLSHDDLVQVLAALQNASVVTDPTNPQIVNNGGPADVQQLVTPLGTKSQSKAPTIAMLSTGVELLSKPSQLHVPPWQMVSALLGRVALRAATWWANPKIDTTTASTEIGCWDTQQLGDSSGLAVEIATKGHWNGTSFDLTGGPGADFNHAKIGVSTSGDRHYAIFGDMNQQGAVSGDKCASSQNGRGGLFFVVDNAALVDSVRDLIQATATPAVSSGGTGGGGLPTVVPDEAVFFNSNGHSYHRANCRFTGSHSLQTTVEDAKQRGLSPCGICKPPQ